jgi:hypothetical protein
MANRDSLHGLVGKIVEVPTKSGIKKVLGRVSTETGPVTIKAFGIEANILKASEGFSCTLCGRSEPSIREPGSFEFVVNRLLRDAPVDSPETPEPKKDSPIAAHPSIFGKTHPSPTSENPFYREPSGDTKQIGGTN